MKWVLINLLLEAPLLSRLNFQGAPVASDILANWQAGGLTRRSPMWLSRWDFGRLHSAACWDWEGTTAFERPVDISALHNLLEEVCELAAFQLAVDVALFGEIAAGVVDNTRASILRPNVVGRWFDLGREWAPPTEELLLATTSRVAVPFLRDVTDYDTLVVRSMLVVHAAIAEPWQVPMPSLEAAKSAVARPDVYVGLGNYDVRRCS